MTVSSLVEPAFSSIPAYSKTLGPEVADVAEMAGFAPDPEQRLALDAIFGIGPDSKAAALEAAIVACRQNIKTGLFKQCALGWLFVTDQRLIVWSAHEFSTSQEAHRDLSELITNCDPLRRRVKAITNGNGDEGIELLTGQRVKFKARTKTGGRGLSGDKIVLDEAFALQPTHMGSLFPLLSVRPDPQIVYGSSAGLTYSAVLRGIRDRGRSGVDPRLAYLEWADDLGGECAAGELCDHRYGSAVGCRMDDERRWFRANTQLGRRMTLEYVRAERRALDPEEFGRERMGEWDDPPPSVGGALDPLRWAELADPDAAHGTSVVFGVDVDESRSGSVAVTWNRPDGAVQVMLAEERLSPATAVDRVAELYRSWGGRVVLGGPSAALEQDLHGKGVPCQVLSGVEFARACGGLEDRVKDGSLRHGNQPALNEAVRQARWRSAGTSGERAFQLKDSPGVGPLAAATRALAGLGTSDPWDSVW